MVILKYDNLIFLILFLLIGCKENRSEYELKSLDEQKSTMNSFLERVSYSNDKGLKSAKYFLDLGVPVNSKDKNGFSALHIAMINHSPNVVLMLLENGADVNAKDKDSATVLHYAASGGYPTVVKTLIEKGADVNAKAIHDLTPALCAASLWKSTYEDSLKLMWEYLTKAGIDVNAVDSDGNSALLRAVVQYKLNEEDIEVPLLKDTGEFSSIGDYVRMRGRANQFNYSWITYVLKPLLEKGADPSIKNKDGINAKEYSKKLFINEKKEVRKYGSAVNYDKDPERNYRTYSAYMMLNKE